MKHLSFILSVILVSGFFFTLGGGEVFTTANAASTNNSETRGTYRTVTVPSFEECEALCKSNPQCRKGEARQPDTRKPIVHCRLLEVPLVTPDDLDIDAILAELNAYRKAHGQPALALNTKLSNASKVRAQHSAIAALGQSPGLRQRLKDQDYAFELTTENIASGYRNWQTLFETWKNKSTSNKNLLGEGITDFGIAMVYEPTTEYKTYWSMILAKPYVEPELKEGYFRKSTPITPLNINIALADLNAYRASKGLNSLTLSPRLTAASQVHAQDLAIHNYSSPHTGTDGSTAGERAKRQGYIFSLIGENVAAGQRSWEDVFLSWQKSPGHNKNLLMADATQFGVALVQDQSQEYQAYWAMLVGTPLYP